MEDFEDESSHCALGLLETMARTDLAKQWFERLVIEPQHFKQPVFLTRHNCLMVHWRPEIKEFVGGTPQTKCV